MKKIMLMCVGLCCFGLSQATQNVNNLPYQTEFQQLDEEQLEKFADKSIIFSNTFMTIPLEVKNKSLHYIIGHLDAIKRNFDDKAPHISLKFYTANKYIMLFQHNDTKAYQGIWFDKGCISECIIGLMSTMFCSCDAQCTSRVLTLTEQNKWSCIQLTHC
jgi:hypothetical protein